ncbi:MAG: FTR1 family protein [Polyangiaceae bacterium]
MKVKIIFIKWCLLTACMLATLMAGRVARAQDIAETVPRTWQLLDYIATDYGAAIRDGVVVSASEYAEMKEFSSTARNGIQALPAATGKAELVAQANALVDAVAHQATREDVARNAHALGAALLAAYPVPITPARTPDLALGALLYQKHCASCHGTSGHGDGLAAQYLDPPPIDFTDVKRADQRSPLSLYEVISNGVKGTRMDSYSGRLSPSERWATAYYVGTLAYTPMLEAGSREWKRNASARAQIGSLQELSMIRADELATTLGRDHARAVVGWLRAHPETAEHGAQGLALARGRVAASVEFYRAGNASEAIRLALSAYLDGVEPVEPRLTARDSALTHEVETSMGAYRTALAAGRPASTVASQASHVDALLARAEDVLADDASGPWATFLAAFIILTREGLEALLVVVALLAFLARSERRESTRYVHLGWVLALVAGGITWALARYAISISGAGRELTEGLSSLFAAGVLLFVGLWMHQKSMGGRWQAYLKEKMTEAASRRSAWFLFGLAFISVYREVFETILFYVALWNEGQEHSLLAGMAVGAVVLALIAWVLLKTSRRLPLGSFFSASSALIAVLAVVLTGKGIAALQEAGWVAVSVTSVPRIEVLGIYPTWQTLLAQLVVIGLIVIGVVFNIARAHRELPSRSVPE